MTIDQEKFKPTTWGKNKDFKKPFEITTPSGQLVLVRRLEITDIMRLGIIEEMDFFAKALAEKDEKPKTEGDEPEDESAFGGFAKILSKSGNFDKMEITVNTIVRAGVIAPKLYDVPRDEAARQDGLLYVDDVSFTDKIFLFGEVFDMDGLSTFREEPETSVGDVQPVTDVSLPAE